MVVFERDPGCVAADADDPRDALASLRFRCIVIRDRDSQPRFGNVDGNVLRFASLRYDTALDDDDRLAVSRALAAHATSIASWRTIAARTYAIATCAREFDATIAAATGAIVSVPPIVVLRIKPAFVARVPDLARTLGGAAAPVAVIDVRVLTDELVVELQPLGEAIALVIALVDATLVATPGRAIQPVLPISDAVLARYASLRLGDAELDVSRVLDPYVEHFTQARSSVS